MQRGLIAVLMFLFCLQIVFGATIKGDVYDFSLEEVQGARVTVNTTPEQHIIAKDGSYSIQIPNGFYELRAELIEDNRVVAFEVRNLSVKQTGTYVIDFILFPSFEEIDDLQTDQNFSFPEEDDNDISFFVLVVVFLIILFLFLYKFNKKITKNVIDSTKVEDLDLESVISVIKKEGGRTTQKEIRKHLPLSEAKISLMITELEHKGIVEKIKKGRGNVIILKKN